MLPWPFSHFYNKIVYSKIIDDNIIDIDEELDNNNVFEYEENYNLMSNKIAYKIISVIDNICPCLIIKEN